jgi:predicted dehydrogenase
MKKSTELQSHGNGKMSRRAFAGRSAAAAAASILAPSFLFGDGISPNSKLNIACVGAGGKGRSDADAASDGNNIVALCDVDDRQGAETYEKFPKARRFKDYRVMLDKMGNDIDAVTISTPDHMHFPVAMLAMQMGKHVCVQKPLTNTIWEAHQLLEASRKYKVVTQMGIQGHTNEGTRLLKEWLDAGAIGAVQEILYWTNRPVWVQDPATEFPAQSVPPGVDWDLWQGTVHERPYNKQIMPKWWRAWWDYGCGALGDVGCHCMDAGFWALDLGAPEWVEASTTKFSDTIGPRTTHLVYQFPARGEKPPVKVTWMDGGLMPARPPELESDQKLDPEWGQLFVGDKGKIFVADAYCNSFRLIPETKMKDFQPPGKTLKRSPTPGQPQKEWTYCIKNGKTPGANFEYAVPLTEMVLIGNLAIRANQRVEWDSKAQRVTNVPAANDFLKRDYRAGWEPKVVL